MSFRRKGIFPGEKLAQLCSVFLAMSFLSGSWEDEWHQFLMKIQRPEEQGEKGKKRLVQVWPREAHAKKGKFKTNKKSHL